VADDEHVAPLGANSKFETDFAFLESLFTVGRQAADSWLVRHGADIGVRSTLDIEKTFLSKNPRG
jgi:NTE family protein